MGKLLAERSSADRNGDVHENTNSQSKVATVHTVADAQHRESGCSSPESILTKTSAGSSVPSPNGSSFMPSSNHSREFMNDDNIRGRMEIPKVILLDPDEKTCVEDPRYRTNSYKSSQAALGSDPFLDVSQATGTDCSVSSCNSSNKDSSIDESLHQLQSVNSSGTKMLPATMKPTISMMAKSRFSEFSLFRIQYLIVHTAIMLADGLQGTHLYVLYEGYGYSVSSLYSLGFVAGALSSPFIGPIVDKIGRKKAAMLYCFLEMVINYLELFPIFSGLITSRVIGGITTNLLFSVFESWLVSEHRQRGFEEEKLEIILRDSTIVSNSAAIMSGYLAHCLASSLGPVGPFQGAVALTCVALFLVASMWNENYGRSDSSSQQVVTLRQHMVGAYNTIIKDSKISRIGIIQGLSEGSLQTFVFLWSPALRAFSKSAPEGTLGLDKDGEPAYGLIFGAFMACGVLGGFAEPYFRKAVTKFIKVDNDKAARQGNGSSADSDSSNKEELRSVAVDVLCTLCYLTAAMLLLIPYLVSKNNPYAFTTCVMSFLLYEFTIGLYMPCEGVIRSIYMPNESICSLMTMLRVIVNVAVAVGVFSTNYVPFASAYAALFAMMVVAAILQISLVSKEELADVLARVSNPWKTFRKVKTV